MGRSTTKQSIKKKEIKRERKRKECGQDMEKYSITYTSKCIKQILETEKDESLKHEACFPL